MRRFTGYFFICFLLVFCVNIQAKEVTTDDSEKDSTDARFNRLDAAPYLSFHVSYLNKITYAGRYYGDNGIGLYPTFIYRHKSGLELNVSNIIWTKFTPSLVESDITAGYSKNLNSWSGLSLNYSRTFMYYGNDSDRRALNNSLSIGLSFYPDWFNASVEYSYLFGMDKASALHLDISKDFPVYHLFGSDKLVISPKLQSYIGQQIMMYKFFSKHTVKLVNQGKGQGKGKKSGGVGSTTTTTTTTTEMTEPGTVFQVMDYEAGIAANYRIGHITFEISFNAALPQNLPADYTFGDSPIYYMGGYLKYTF